MTHSKRKHKRDRIFIALAVIAVAIAAIVVSCSRINAAKIERPKVTTHEKIDLMWDRLKLIYGVDTDQELAEELRR